MSTVMLGMTENQQMVLCPQDFPLGFTNGQHPGDFTSTDKPTAPECFFHHRGKFNRLWWRVSWKLRNGNFTTMSFLLDTGVPNHLYLCDNALNVLEEDGQVFEDGDMDVLYLNLFGRKCPVEPTPNTHIPVNIIGLKLLKRFGLELYEEEPHFSFKAKMPFLDSTKL